jgi:hypothetical protein
MPVFFVIFEGLISMESRCKSKNNCYHLSTHPISWTKTFSWWQSGHTTNWNILYTPRECHGAETKEQGFCTWNAGLVALARWQNWQSIRIVQSMTCLVHMCNHVPTITAFRYTGLWFSIITVWVAQHYVYYPIQGSISTSVADQDEANYTGNWMHLRRWYWIGI